jgi:hypothetical protein
MIRLDIGTLSGILSAQRRLQKVIPVDSGKYGLYQAVLNRALELSLDEARELADALISLQSHCRSLEISQIEVEGDLQ